MPGLGLNPSLYLASMDQKIDEERSLQSLVEASRTPKGRSDLAAAGALLPALLLRLPSSPPNLLLLHLRLLRNLCAGEAASQDAFVDSDGPVAVAAVLSPPVAAAVARVGLQALGNAALGGDRHRAAVWARFFPAALLELARIRDRGVCDTLCMVLDTCCSSEGGRVRLEELCADGWGLPILLEVITTASTVGYNEEWLGWLLSKACVEEVYFSRVFPKLRLFSDSNNSQFNMQQAFILGVISNCLNERPEEVTISKEFSLNVLKILKEASNNVDFTSRGSFALPTGSPAIDVLGFSLTILRDVCASESHPAKEAPVDSLLSAGILEQLLGLLRDLEPPSIVRKSIQHGRNEEGLPAMTDSLKVCPYKGFRRDVVAVISNCLHRRKHVQDEIRVQGGIPLLLQQCVVDEGNSFLREWGLMAVRNLLEGNEENQREVSELKLQGAVDTPEITSLGLKVEVDENKGRAKLVNIS